MSESMRSHTLAFTESRVLHCLGDASTGIDKLIDLQASQNEIQKLRIAKSLILQTLFVINMKVVK
ncbi:hypothetical protein MUP01_12070 [Candidatus Bathyarchaeota archaeon]|nr:hypothetical protein [Candidatus Bathyarchaeota archaeon]